MSETTIKDKIVDFFESRIKESTLYICKEKLTKNEIELKKLIKENRGVEAGSKKISSCRDKQNYLISELQKAREVAAVEEIPNWFDSKAEEGLSFDEDKFFSAATHLMKFSHGLSLPESIRADELDNSDVLAKCYIGTHSLSSIDLDISYGNGIYITHALFLLIVHDNLCILDRIVSKDFDFFKDFSSNEERLAKWESGFSSFIGKKTIENADMAKQIYFPTALDSYCIVCPIFSSSLAHAIYLEINKNKYSEFQKSARKSKKSDKFSEFELKDYPNIAIQRFGGKHPRNISALNHVRGGKTYLLPSRPPQWRKQETPPTVGKHSFWREYDRRAWKAAKELKDYLNRIYNKTSTKPRRDIRDESVEELIDTLFLYAAEVKNLTEHKGWSTQSALPLAEQLWLDPLREDEEFQRQRDTKDWQIEIAERFASWLNRKLDGGKLVMKDAEYAEWYGKVKKRFKQELEDFES